MQDERRLQRALANRDRAAWSLIYDRHVQEVFGLIYHLVGRDRVLAEDIDQEVWLLCWKDSTILTPPEAGFATG